MEGYADRPALAKRAVRIVNDPQTGRTSLESLPRLETVSYRQLSNRVGAVASALTNDPVHALPTVMAYVCWASPRRLRDRRRGVVQVGAVSVPLRPARR